LSLELADVSPQMRPAVVAALEAAGVGEGHLGVELVGEERMRKLNREHRGVDDATDVLAFPLDGVDPGAGPRELGDVVICPQRCSDQREAAVHGVLHLCGYDHEADDGEMLELQAQVMARLDGDPAGADAERASKRTDEVSTSERERSSRRVGFVGLAGRPNVGKSTLVNAVTGVRVAIVSERPQTTRRSIRGVATDERAGWQLILVDLPGVQKPRDVLTERMQSRVERELADSDAVLFVVNGEEGVGPGDRFIDKALLGAEHSIPVLCVVNKTDRLGKGQTAEVLTAAAELESVDEVFPISARSGDGLEALVRRLAELVPEGPYLYPPEQSSDQPSEVLLAELVREQVLNRTRDEIPHSVEVAVTDVERRDDGLVTVRAEVWVEADSQKAILIGRRGSKVKEIGSGARRELERELGAKVHLDLRVKVRKRWRRDEALLDRLGIE